MMVKEFELDPLADVWIFLDAQEAVQAKMAYTLDESAMVGLWKRKVRFVSALDGGIRGEHCRLAGARLPAPRPGGGIGQRRAAPGAALARPGRQAVGQEPGGAGAAARRGEMPLRGLVETQVKHMVRGSTVVLITASVDKDVALTVDFLRQRGLKPVAVLIEAVSFGGRSGTDELAANLRVLGVPVRMVANGCDLEAVLSNNGFQ